jgi:hypothetical protein
LTLLSETERSPGMTPSQFQWTFVPRTTVPASGTVTITASERIFQHPNNPNLHCTVTSDGNSKGLASSSNDITRKVLVLTLNGSDTLAATKNAVVTCKHFLAANPSPYSLAKATVTFTIETSVDTATPKPATAFLTRVEKPKCSQNDFCVEVAAVTTTFGAPADLAKCADLAGTTPTAVACGCGDNVSAPANYLLLTPGQICDHTANTKKKD